MNSDNYKEITAMLWRDGYHAAARLIEKLAGSIQPDVEMEWMKQFVTGVHSDDGTFRKQVKALWTAYCIRHGLDVDTRRYDEDLEQIWLLVSEDWIDYESFYNFMCEYLV